MADFDYIGKGRGILRPSSINPGRYRPDVKNGLRSYVTPLKVSGIVSREQTERERLLERLAGKTVDSIKDDLIEIKDVYEFARSNEKYELMPGLMQDLSEFRHFIYLCGRYHRQVKPEITAALPKIRASVKGLEAKVKKALRKIGSK